MTAIYALYPDPVSAQRAVDGLRAAGVAARDVAVISAEPFDEYEFGRRDAATRLPWIAAAGGVLGLTFGAWLTTMTQRAWPIETGGMPIVAWWPNLIIMFELTMLGAIVATVVGLLITAGLPARDVSMYDPAITDGFILVGVRNPPRDLVTSLERALTAVGGARAKTLS
jgi:hypothetical protein